MLLPVDDETMGFFYEEEPYEQIIDAVELLEIADDITVRIEPVGYKEGGELEYEIYLSPTHLIHNPAVVTDAMSNMEMYLDDEGHEVYVDFLDEFKIGNIASFYLTLEHIVETF